METKAYTIKFIEPLLATCPGNPEIARDYVLSKCKEGIQSDEEGVVVNATEELQKEATIFPRDEQGKPFIWNYLIKGFFKAACLAIMQSDSSETVKQQKDAHLTKYLHKRTIDTQIFIQPRRIYLSLPKDTDPDELPFLQRPLRGQTMQGERIALARSEMAPAGTVLSFEVLCLQNTLWSYIESWLAYGELSGLGQWRNASYGSFVLVQ